MMPTFDDLMRGIEGFPPLNQLVNIPNELGFVAASAALKEAVNVLLADTQTHRPIVEFTIGKTFAKVNATIKFDQSNLSTWDLNGIRSRWASYNKNGYHGMVILCALTRESLPAATDVMKAKCIYDQQNYALALESDLIAYFCYCNRDIRIGNTSFSSGKIQKDDAIAGVLYMAYKLQHDEQAEPVEQNQPEQNEPVEQNQAEQNEPIEEKQAEQNELVEHNKAEENEPVEEKQAEQNVSVEEQQAEQNETDEEQVEELVHKLEDVGL